MPSQERSSSRPFSVYGSPQVVYTLICLLSLCILPAVALGDAAQAWPVVHLRTATIHTRSAEQGFAAGSHRRRLLQHNCHTDHPAWGGLRSARQVLAAHRPALTHLERHELVEFVEGAGARVMGYFPDDTLLLVGAPGALEAAASHAAFLWAGAFDPGHKVAPEWGPLLEQVEAAAAGAGLGGSAGSRGVGAALNMTQVAQAKLAAALAALPVRSVRRAGEWPRVGIRVAFPAAAAPQPHAPDHPHAASQDARIARARRERAETHAGDAAAADWAPLLRGHLGSGEAEVEAAGPSHATVFVPVPQLRRAVAWLAARPAAHWVAPLARHVLRNRQASCITQSGKPAPTPAPKSALDPGLHPLWAAGITGKNQVIGIGDSGLDRAHCFFNDPSVDWASSLSVEGGRRTFSSPTHRKIRLYRAYADFSDSNGHGTHTSGTLAGIPLTMGLGAAGGANVGMAPDAKLAFIDLSSAADGDTITTPGDLAGDYFRWTSEVGAAIHSDSWGSASLTYDSEAAQVDAYCWENPSFLPVFPAGNDGDTGDNSGATTVNSPATSKNCLAVGATQTSAEGLDAGAGRGFKVWTAEASTGPALSSTFPVLGAAFGASVGTLGAASYRVAASSPLDACAAIQNPGDLGGAVALVERGGGCTFAQKALAAQAAGAAAVLLFDNVLGAYFPPDAAVSGAVSVPTMLIPRRLGQNLLAVLVLGRPVNISFSPAVAPAYGFDNLASFSSQGPVGRDGRVKPDIVAPGTVQSAARATACEVATYGGTSMATPVVAGSAALVRQYYQDGYYPSGAPVAGDAMQPSAALLKATLVNGAAPLRGYEADTGLPIDPPPSTRQGYGRVSLGTSLFLAARSPAGPARLQVLDAVPIRTGEVHQYCLAAGGGAVTATLVWTDYPGSPAAANSLVNDLDLVVRAEGLNGVPVLGNGGSVEDSSAPDAVNNIEQVALGSVPAGKLAVEVRGRAVQAGPGPQPYALVISGDFTGTLVSAAGGGGAGCAVVVAVITGGPSGITNQPAPTFAFTTQSGTSGGVQFECRMGGGDGAVGGPGTADWAACASPAAFASLPDGAYTFAVRAAGESIATSQSFTKDTTPPQVALAAAASPLAPGAAPPAAPPAAAALPTAAFTFSASDASRVTYECQLAVTGGAPQQKAPAAGDVAAAAVQLGAWFNCSSPAPLTLAWLLPGRWAFSVRATDEAGNAAQPATFAWDVAFDPAQRYARVLAGPVLKVGAAEAAFELAALSSAGGAVGDAGGAALECSWAAGGADAAVAQWSPCPSPVTFKAAADGPYKFAARVAGDPAAPAPGGPDPPTWAVGVVDVDTTPPAATVRAGPTGGAAVSSRDVAFEFEINEAGSTAVCSMSPEGGSPGPATPCASPASSRNLTDGRYTFAVTPTDAVGNVGAPATAAFVVDTAPPTISSLSLPTATTADAVSVTFDAADGGAGVKNVSCRVQPLAIVPEFKSKVDPEAAQWDWVECASPWSGAQGLVPGHWAVGVRAFDNAGLASAPAERDLWVDRSPPVANVTNGPPSDTVMSGGTAVFSLSDASIPPSQPPTLGSPVQWQTLLQSITQEQFDAYRSGAAGGGANTPGPKTVQSLRADTAAADEPAQQAVTLGKGDVGDWANCGDVCTYEGLAGGSYVFQARGTDAAGNAGTASAPYPFQATGAASSGLPSWALPVIAGVGGVALLLILASIVTCCRRRRREAAARPPPGAMHANGAAPYSYAGGWDPRQPYQQPPQYYAPSPANGAPYAAYPPYANGGPPRVAGARALPPPQDAVEAQELALALAASQREAQREREAAAAAQSGAGQADAELRAAIEASLREERRRGAGAAPAGVVLTPVDEDAEVRAAIEASLREQGRGDVYGAASVVDWPTAPSASAPSVAGDWPPSAPAADWPPPRR